MTYSVRAVDKQGNISEATETQQVHVLNDNVLDASLTHRPSRTTAAAQQKMIRHSLSAVSN